jgi:hypothetical protein
VNKNLENPVFLGTLAPATGYRNPHPLSWIKFLGGIASLLVVSLSLGEAAQSVTLAWDANSEPNIAGYVLRYGATRGEPSQNVDVGQTTTATVSNLADGTTYFFTVTALNTLGFESPPSNEVSYTTPSVAGSSNIAIGETKVLTTSDAGNGNLLVTQQANLTQAATIQSLSFYVTRASGKLRLGIFDATGPKGGPGRKKAETAEITPTVGWNNANVIAPVSLPQGTYWLAYLASDNNLAFVKNLSGQARYYTYSYGPMPATFSTSPKGEVVHWSLFATFSTPGVQLPTHALTVINGTGSGNYTEGTQIRVSANPPVAGQRFDGWTRDWQILTNPFIPTTTALMLVRDLTIEATYR